MKPHHYLIGSSFYFFFPIVVFFYRHLTYSNTYFELVLATLLSLNIIFSSIFWSNPLARSNIHRLDGLFGRISLVSFSIYTLFLKSTEIAYKIAFLFSLFMAMYFFYYSNYYSSHNWCSREHVSCHFMFHICITSGCIFTFL
jgi:hypothetical protein